MSHDEQHLNDVDHGYIRYANVWEDPYLLLEGLSPKSTDKVLSIASAGDNAFALLSANPEYVVAVDLNKTQLYLTELKSLSIRELEREDYLNFVGFTPSTNRIKTYKALRAELSHEARLYWDGKEEELGKGIIYQGKFEKYLAAFAKKMLPYIHTRRRVHQLFESKSAEEQAEFFDKKWNNLRWKAMFRIFFSKQVMGIFGRDPAFLAQVESHVGKTIKATADRHLASVYAQSNPMLYYCLQGDFGHYLPLYAQEKNYAKIRARLSDLHIEHGYAQDTAKKYGKFDAFNLSNIFEYMNAEIFENTAKSLRNMAYPQARFAYWNLMVQREMSTIENDITRVKNTHNWSERDQGFFYMQFVVDKLQG